MKSTMICIGILFSLCACSESQNPVLNDIDFENRRPLKPHNPNPPAGETLLTTDLLLSWECSDPDGDVVTYDVVFGKQNAEKLIVQDHPEKSFDPGSLDPGHFYGWHVIAKDEHGTTITSDHWKFKTQ